MLTMIENCLKLHTYFREGKSERGRKGGRVKDEHTVVRLSTVAGIVTCRGRLKGAYAQVKMREGKYVRQGTETISRYIHHEGRENLNA